MRRRCFTRPPSRRRLATVLEGWAVFRLERAAAHLSDAAEEALAEHVLEVRDFAVLLLAAERPFIPQSTIGQRLGVDRSTLSARLQALEEDGLVIRSPHPADARQTAVEVSATGKRALRSAAEILRAVEERFLAPLSEERCDELRDTLRALEPPAPVLGDLYLLGRPGAERD